MIRYIWRFLLCRDEIYIEIIVAIAINMYNIDSEQSVTDQYRDNSDGTERKTEIIVI